MLLNHQQSGTASAPPLIILHGLFGSLKNWNNITTTLAPHFNIFAVDLRNHGASFHSDDMDYAVMVEDIKTLMAHHQLSNAFFIGHSIGGKVAMAFSNKYPQKVIQQIIVDIAPRLYAPEHNTIFQALLGADLSSGIRQNIDQQLTENIPQQDVRQFLLMGLRKKNSGELHWLFNLDSLHNNYPALLASPEVADNNSTKSLFIRGALSAYINDDDQALIHKKYPAANIITIEHAGHWVHAQQPAAFCQAVSTFLLTA